MDGQTDGWMDGWIDIDTDMDTGKCRQTDRWMIDNDGWR
jgi:hypothetical protein